MSGHVVRVVVRRVTVVIAVSTVSMMDRVVVVLTVEWHLQWWQLG